MIQRIQSIWLLVTALLCAALLKLDLYTAHVVENGVDTLKSLRVNDHYPSLLLVIVLIALPLVNIFLYKNRKRQKSLIAFNIVALGGFLATLLMRVGSFTNPAQGPAPTNGSYGVGAIIPVVCMMLLILALRGINKDEKLVRSLDRLR